MALTLRTRNYVSLGLLLVLIPALGYVWYRRLHVSTFSISSSGGESIMAIPPVGRAYYLQTAPEWENEPLGKSGGKMADIGCTVCCVSMAFDQLGLPMNPGALNAALNHRNGFTNEGLLKWEMASSVSKNTLVFDIPDKPSHAAIDAAIKAGNPVITRILLMDVSPHWVLIVGKDGIEYLVKDPLCEEKTIQRLSSLSQTIHSIRIARRK